MPRETFYDEIEIEDFTWDPLANVFHYPCPCGDRFEITKAQLRDGDEVARCPSCSLLVRVIYEWDDFEDYDSAEEEEGERAPQNEEEKKGEEPTKQPEAAASGEGVKDTEKSPDTAPKPAAGSCAQRPLDLPEMLDKLKVDPGTGAHGDDYHQRNQGGATTSAKPDTVQAARGAIPIAKQDAVDPAADSKGSAAGVKDPQMSS